MSTPPLSVNGHALQSLRLHVPHGGVWTADVQLTSQPKTPLPAQVRLHVAGTELLGTIIETHDYGMRTGARIAAGGGGWSKVLPKRSYHNDVGLKSVAVAGDAAREAGEVLGTFAPGNERLRVDFVRREDVASVTLEIAAGGAPWWVDYAGVTNVGPRPSTTVPMEAYQLLAFNPVHSVVLLAVDDLSQLTPGRVISEPKMLAGPMVIRDLEVTSDNGGALRASAWVQPVFAANPNTPPVRSRLADAFSACVDRVSEPPLYGSYRYRVIATRGDLRVDLQAVRASLGLPDLSAVPQCPGVPGLAANLTEGSEVLVTFVDGDRQQPLITAYAGPGATGFAPVGLVLGDEDGAPAARQGDSVEVLLPPAQMAGIAMISGVPTPIQALVTWVAPKGDGVITGGSGKVRIA